MRFALPVGGLGEHTVGGSLQNKNARQGHVCNYLRYYGWRHALRSEWPFIIIIMVPRLERTVCRHDLSSHLCFIYIMSKLLCSFDPGWPTSRSTRYTSHRSTRYTSCPTWNCLWNLTTCPGTDYLILVNHGYMCLARDIRYGQGGQGGPTSSRGWREASHPITLGPSSSYSRPEP